jgi:benzodiazapine receptor
VYTTVPARPSRGRRRPGVGALLVFLLVLAGIAAFEGAVSTNGVSDWFDSSAQVVWTAPRWLSRAVWAAVFLGLAVSGWIIWRGTHTVPGRGARAGYVASLVLLTVWPPIYLGGYPLIGTPALWIAFAVAVLLSASVAALIVMVWNRARAAAFLLLPIACWLVYVTTINLGDAVLASLD